MDEDKRDTAIVLLQDHYAKNRLEIEEFERRVEIAERASSKGELDRALDGLPTVAELVPLRSDSAPVRVSTTLGSISRRGVWTVPARMELRALLGNVELDLSDAEMGRGETVIDARATFGAITIVVADDVEVQCEGSAFAGSFEQMGQRARSNKDPRRVRITGSARFGSVDIIVRKRRPPNQSLLEDVRDGLRDGVRALLGK